MSMVVLKHATVLILKWSFQVLISRSQLPRVILSVYKVGSLLQSLGCYDNCSDSLCTSPLLSPPVLYLNWRIFVSMPLSYKIDHLKNSMYEYCSNPIPSYLSRQVFLCLQTPSQIPDILLFKFWHYNCSLITIVYINTVCCVHLVWPHICTGLTSGID